MGCCTSVQVNNNVGKARDQEIEEQIKKDRQKMSNEVKLLLLGSGESGKSTLLKQMRIIHDCGFPQEERLSYREIVFSNLIESMKNIVNAMDKLKIQLAEQQESLPAYQLIAELPEQMECDYDLPVEISEAIKLLWQDDGVKYTYSRRNEFQLNDSAA